ncbi:ABC1 family-domain-containing protein [Pelagophyceae sp. CCMP2097]|nr:ABC1 family-domain-containing protein [Pelagophyceae sp. CCMP2097]
MGLDVILSGGRRSLSTAAAAASLALGHVRFQRELQSLPDSERAARSRLYLVDFAAQLRDLFLANGGFQVKLGQMICMQKGILPKEITNTLAPCCEAAQSVPLREVSQVVCERLGVEKLGDVFASVGEEPIASASIAQVHRAKLVDGEDVILKVQHRNVERLMQADVAFLPYLMSMMAVVEPEHGMEMMATLVEDMLGQECDFRIEGHNRERLAAILERAGASKRSPHCDVSLPKVHWSLCREGCMVQEFVYGALTLTALREAPNPQVPFGVAVRELAHVFAECIFVHGYTHNDLHPGNVMVRANSKLSKASNGNAVKIALRVHGNFLAASIVALLYLASAVSAVLALRSAWGWVLLPLARSNLFAVCLVVALARSFDPRQAFGVGAAAVGEHRALRAKVDDFLQRRIGARFELVLIDHGFHTDVPEALRLTFCKMWVGTGLRDEALLREAAIELGCAEDDFDKIPLMLCLMPWQTWLDGRFPGLTRTAMMLRDKKTGLRAIRPLIAKIPKAIHVIMRSNRQVFALFQMQYGMVPKMRLEFMRAMTRMALVGLGASRSDTLPDPANLDTADCAFFLRETAAADKVMRQRFKWEMPLFVEPDAEATELFIKAMREQMRAEGKND